MILLIIMVLLICYLIYKAFIGICAIGVGILLFVIYLAVVNSKKKKFKQQQEQRNKNE